MASEAGLHPELLETVMKITQDQRHFVLDKLEMELGGPGSLRDKIIAVLGLAYKDNTDDMRDAPAIALVTLRQGLKPHGFFGLSSVVGTLRSVPWGRLGERRSGGGKARHEYLHSDLHDQAVPGPLLFPCLVQRDEWPTACSWHPGEKQHPRLSTLSPWERTHTGGGFPCAIVVRTTLPKPVDWVPVASLCQIAHTMVQHGSVFTAGPSPANPYTFQLFKVLWVSSHRGAKKWKCIREWLKPRTPNYGGRDPVACGGLKPFSVKHTASDGSCIR
jgi:hypothetical protein